MLTRFFVFLSLLLFIGACSLAPQKPSDLPRGDYSYTKKYLAWLIEKEMKAHEVPAVSIAVVDDQRVIWSSGFGYANVKNRVPATSKTLYRAGSISKLFTAMAAMQLLEQGKMDIDAPLTQYLPDFSIKSRFSNAPVITPRQLMTHHSGLPGNHLQGMWRERPQSFTQLVDKIKDDYVAMPPGKAFAYSNLAYALLGHAVSNVAGEPYVQYMHKSILQPLGMRHAAFVAIPAQSQNTAQGYRNGEAVAMPGFRDIPAGGLQTSVDDLAQFIKMIFAEGNSGTHQVIQSSTLAEMLRRQNGEVALDFDLGIGLAWFLENKASLDGERVASHGGGTLLFHSQLSLIPEQKLGVIVMSNAQSGRGLVDKVAQQALKLALEAKTAKRLADEAEQNVPPLLDRLEKSPFKLEGHYAGTLGHIEVSRDGKRYYARALGKKLSLQARRGGWFSPQYKLLGLIPLPLGLEGVLVKPVIADNRHVLIVRKQGRDFLLAEKIHKRTIPQRLRAWRGRYRIRNPDQALPIEDIELSIEDGLAFISYRIPVLAKQALKLALLPVADDTFVIAGIGRGLGETLRLVQHGEEQIIMFSGYEIVREQETGLAREQETGLARQLELVP